MVRVIRKGSEKLSTLLRKMKEEKGLQKGAEDVTGTGEDVKRLKSAKQKDTEKKDDIIDVTPLKKDNKGKIAAGIAGAAGVAGAGVTGALLSDDDKSKTAETEKPSEVRKALAEKKKEEKKLVKEEEKQKKDFIKEGKKRSQFKKQITQASNPKKDTPEGISDSLKKLSEMEEFESPELKSALGKLDQRLKDAKALYKKDKESAEWAKFAETMGHALVQLGAGAYGMKHNIDLSGIKFDKNDWEKKFDRIGQELDREVAGITAERKELLSSREKDLQRLRQNLLDKYKIAKGEKSLELQKEGLDLRRQQILSNERIARAKLVDVEKTRNQKRLLKEAKDKKLRDKDMFDLSQKLRKEQDSKEITKDTAKSSVQFDKLKNLIINETPVDDVEKVNIDRTFMINGEKFEPRDPTAAQDLGIIFTYMKILDPPSVVREGEQQLAINTTNLPGWVQNHYNRVVSGQKLNPQQRKEFLKSGSLAYKAQYDAYMKDSVRVKESAERMGLDTDLIMPRFTKPIKVDIKDIDKQPKPKPKQIKPAPVKETKREKLKRLMELEKNERR